VISPKEEKEVGTSNDILAKKEVTTQRLRAREFAT